MELELIILCSFFIRLFYLGTWCDFFYASKVIHVLGLNFLIIRCLWIEWDRLRVLTLRLSSSIKFYLHLSLICVWIGRLRTLFIRLTTLTLLAGLRIQNSTEPYETPSHQWTWHWSSFKLFYWFHSSSSILQFIFWKLFLMGHFQFFSIFRPLR